MTPHDADKASSIVAMIKNAQDLLSDARLLLTSGRDARAFALSVLAREEAGKALLVLAQGLGDPVVHQLQLTSHRQKLHSAGSAAIFLFGNADRIPGAAHDLKRDETHKEKMAGFYVDWRDGHLQTPDCIGHVSAAEAVDIASKLIERLVPILGSVTPEALEAARRLEAELRPVFDQYLEEAGVGPATELARELLVNSSNPGGRDVDHE